MDVFAQSSVEVRRLAFEQAAAARQLSPQIVEKDFWVCWTLKRLFVLPTIGEHLIFKGGTSLSKVFKVIERFSEDIDVSIDRGFLGFGGDNEPEAGGSNKEKQRRIDALRVACQQKIANELQPALEAIIKSKVRSDETWSLRTDTTDPDGQTLLFDYPSAWPVAGVAYVRQTVKIEMGARADHWPCEAKPITPYVAEEFPQAFRETSCTVKVLSVERTFWEKATILHAEFHRPADKAIPDRFSRHYCDFHELIRKGVAKSATERLDLLERVARHKSLFFRSSWAKFGEAAKGTLKISPRDERVSALREDYTRMQEMFFGEQPEFGAMMAALREWETQFNRK
ncbi:MAG: nucleotidyl transferase AbiEii/AbiGii toxin family protein [Verrucomicrobiales bacterium]|nr:nucleotidyl transferase AbiEii/AbiGii toxin family protein [Verrucomicrobiales bacterium]